MENLNLIKPEKVQNIINKFCYTIGMTPTSYKVSLTYEEQIIAIGHYLEETVIPALNNNAEAVAELQNLFIQLKDFVENYFDNLDVQDEINNKIDNMINSGVFQNIISSVINTFCFNNIEEMKNSNVLFNGGIVRTLGYYSKNDKGGAFYKITNTQSTDDYQIELKNNLYANIIIDNFLTPEMLGAKGGDNDDTEIIKKCINSGYKILLTQNHKVSSDIEINNPIEIDGNNHSITKISNSTIDNALIYINNTNNVIIKNLIADANYPFYDRFTDYDNYIIIRNNCNYGVRIRNSNNVILENVTSKHGLTGFSISGETPSEQIKLNNCTSYETIGDGVECGNAKNCFITNHFDYKCQDDCYSANTYSSSNYQPKNITFDNCKAIDCFGRVTLGGENIIFNNGIIDGGHQIPFVFESRAHTKCKNCKITNSIFKQKELISSLSLRNKKRFDFFPSTDTENYAENCVVENCSIDTLDTSIPLLTFWNGKNIIFNNINLKGYVIDMSQTDILFSNTIIETFGGLYITTGSKVKLINNKINIVDNDKKDTDYLAVILTSDVTILNNKFTTELNNAVSVTGGQTVDAYIKTDESLRVVSIGKKSVHIANVKPLTYNIANNDSVILENGQLIFNDSNKNAYIYINEFIQINNVS